MKVRRRAMTAIFKREFKAYFQTPIGYIVLMAFYLLFGIVFWLMYNTGSPNTADFMTVFLAIILILTPIITMRLMSDERRQKTDQVLLTSPIKLSSIVLGKFSAAMALYALGFIPMIIYEIIVAAYVSVNLFAFIYLFLGFMLLGASLISLGMLISSFTESTAISALLNYGVNVLLILLMIILQFINTSWFTTVLEKIAFVPAITSFSETMFSIPDVIYYLSITAAFLFLCVRSLEKRRWA